MLRDKGKDIELSTEYQKITISQPHTFPHHCRRMHILSDYIDPTREPYCFGRIYFDQMRETSGFGKTEADDIDDAFEMDSFFACIAPLAPPLSNGFLVLASPLSGPLSSSMAVSLTPMLKNYSNPLAKSQWMKKV